MRQLTSIQTLSIGALALLLTQTASAQVTPGAGYAIKRLAGDNDVGSHFALASIPNGRTGFFYVADQQALYSGGCAGAKCSMQRKLTNVGDRGQFVSALALPCASNRPLVAYYDATNGDLRAGLCNSQQCEFFSTDRVLDNVGAACQHTAMAINPATGFAVVSYYAATLADARLYVCSNADCSAGSVSTIDTQNDAGKNGALAFGANLANFTNLFAVYDDATLGTIKFSRSVLPFNSFGPITLGAGTDAAINVGASGFPDIVYRGPNNALVHVRCLSFDCSGANQTMQTLSMPGQGFAPSITRLPNGNAFITAQQDNSILRGFVCNDLACSAPQVLILDAGPGIGAPSIAASYGDGRPLAFYQDAVNKDVRAAECSSVACTSISTRVSVNGFAVSLPNFALRADGRAVATWIGARTPVVGVCVDIACTSLSIRETGGGNTDARPSIAIRPDGRPFVYYTSVGGTSAWDCNDAECTSGTGRAVSGSGNGTSFISELVLRSDGVPMMIYHNNSNSVFVFTCADINCSAGTSRLLVAEGANTILNGFTTEMRSDNRLIVSYLRFNISDSSIVRRVALCADMNCSNSVITSSGGAVGSFSGPSSIALRDNNVPNVVNPFPSSAQLRLCVSEDCLDAGGTSILPLNLPNNSSTMRLAPGNIPVFDTGMMGSGGLLRCADASCSTAAATTVISSATLANGNFSGRLRLNATHQPTLIFDETVNEDIWLAVPQSDAVFKNGFE